MNGAARVSSISITQKRQLRKRILSCCTVTIIVFNVFIAHGPIAAESPEGPYSEVDEKTGDWAVRLSFIPGAGHLYLGNQKDGLFQFALFGGLYSLKEHYRRRPDYISRDERYVQFDTADLYIAETLDRNDLLYMDLPFFGETALDRQIRMIQDAKLREQNALLEFGPYSRHTYATLNHDMARIGAQSVFFYSVYSTYRDLGRGGYSAQEQSFWQLASAPFRPRFLLRADVILPLLVAGLYANAGQVNPTLVSPGIKKKHAALNVGVLSYNAAVGEEAFFRGYLNHSWSKSWGAWTGGLAQAGLFGIIHSDGSSGSILVPTLFGLYSGYLHHRSGFDIRPNIALHFWWDIIILAAQVRGWREDRRVQFNQREIHYAPVTFQFQF